MRDSRHSDHQMLEPAASRLRLIVMRTVEVIDSELRALTAFRAACAADGAPVRSTAAVDGLLDERAAIARESMTHRRSSTTTPLQRVDLHP
ncbi:gp37 [Mycobacterium phage Che9c]|uniref:Uncharacterized protein n=1 Tax=Mycobacterium phage Che9c TaxID=2907832 RepID=Q854W0_9CAUD|nr:gp37 [Mycobacterium phage Che9c]AAN12598.1 hypothetical protein PBI_CHE9C_37 [Mycobacterium phage Che9c]